MFIKHLAAAVIAAAALSALPAAAQTSEPLRVRGTVVSIEGSKLIVHPKQGADVTVTLADKWTAVGVVKASMADVKPGTFIGTASMPQPDGSLKGLEVLLFPEAMRGFAEGHYGWDVEPKSMMTNATVAKAVDSVDGQTLTLTYKGGEQKVSVPANTPIVTLVDAKQAEVVPGVSVFVPGNKKADGSIDTMLVLFGKDGVVPPM